MRTVVGVSPEREEFRSENIDVELHVVDQALELVVESRPYDPDVYREHHASAYRAAGVPFHEVEPAYRFGHELRTCAPEREWSAVEPTARSFWEMSSPRTWERFERAIRHAWERAGG